jgi:NitT/TauT family transport system substrate-binding protein
VSGTVTIGAVPGIDNAPIYLAQKDGYFAAAGLHVVIDSFSSDSAELQALQAGKIDIAASDYGSIFAAEANSGLDLRILADGYDAGTGSVEILTSPNSGITNPVQLASVVIGYPSETFLSTVPVGHPASLYAAAATSVLSDYMAGEADTIAWKPLPQQQEVNELRSGQLKAILVTEPYISEAESEFGAVEVVDACSGNTANLPLSGYAATKPWVSGDQAAVSDFQSALARAQAEASMIGPIQRVLPSFTGMQAQTAALVSIGTYPTTTNVGSLNRVEELMQNDVMLRQQVNPASMVVR